MRSELQHVSEPTDPQKSPNSPDTTFSSPFFRAEQLNFSRWSLVLVRVYGGISVTWWVVHRVAESYESWWLVIVVYRWGLGEAWWKRWHDVGTLCFSGRVAAAPAGRLRLPPHPLFPGSKLRLLQQQNEQTYFKDFPRLKIRSASP